MPYTTPTLEQFRTKFPTFSGVADSTINAAIEEALSSVDSSWIEADYQPAILYLAAHILTVDGALIAASDLGGAGGIVGAGLVSDMKVGDVSVKMAGAASGGGSGSSSGYATTPYGSRYRDLLRRNHPAVALV
ncbi:DUF4054 domain-containing protein [Bosea sp. 2YAB26]|uniref:DUF4054 domain-containing protein n=1 Tax=Bosea sp. 2YAB26 TaxID=3237478 RepID=UPI003F8F9CB9